MAAETDKFVIATFALWAGDFAYFEQLLREFSHPHDTPPIDEGAERPEDFIRATGALRLRQLWQKRGEFKKLTLEYAGPGIEVTDTPIILKTTHLRATLWRTDEREFLMQGYLKELGWQKELFEQVHRQAGRDESRKVQASIPPTDLFYTHPEGERSMPLGTAWAVPGNPFLQVELTDLGLLEAAGLWTEPRLPDNAKAIIDVFQKLLTALDEPLTEAPR